MTDSSPYLIAIFKYSCYLCFLKKRKNNKSISPMMKHPIPYERPEAEAMELGPMLDVCQNGGTNLEGFNDKPGSWSTSPDYLDDDLMNP